MAETRTEYVVFIPDDDFMPGGRRDCPARLHYHAVTVRQHRLLCLTLGPRPTTAMTDTKHMTADDLAGQRRMAHAILAYAKTPRMVEHGVTASDVLLQIMGGWLWWDGEQLVESGMIVATQQGVRDFCAGKPVRDEDITVARAFIGPRPPGLVINPLNAVKRECSALAAKIAALLPPPALTIIESVYFESNALLPPSTP